MDAKVDAPKSEEPKPAAGEAKAA